MNESAAAPYAALRRAEAIHVRVPFRRPLLDATGEYTHRRVWLIRLTDEAGNEGLGEAALAPTADDAATAGLALLVRETVPALVEGASYDHLGVEGAPGRALLAGISGAFAALDAARAVRGIDARPGSAVPVAATIGFGGPEAGGEAAAQSIELGFETLELRAGFERETGHLVDRVRAIRAAVGPEPNLRVDAGGAWDLDTAIERIRAIEPYRIEFVEQPMAAWDLAGHAALRERGLRIALDEAIDSEGSARAAMVERAVDVLVLRPARVGGAPAIVRIAEAAARSGVAVVVGSYYETGVGIAAGLRIAAGLPAVPATRLLAHALATAGTLRHDLLAVPLTIDHGRMPVPARVALDEREVARLTLERFEATRV